MGINEYVLECHARYVLDEARAATARAALARRAAPRIAPGLTAFVAAVRRAMGARAARARRIVVGAR